MRRFCFHFSECIRKSIFLKAIKRIAFQKSHLAPYLPFMKEPLQKKIARVYNDQSCDDSIGADEGHGKLHQSITKTKRSLQGMLMMSNPCFNPITNWLMIWYIFVFLSIVYTYVQMGMVITYGQVAWTSIHTDLVSVIINLLVILVFIGDILVQMNTGYIFRGVIIFDKPRAVGQYLRTYFIPDIFLVLMLILSIISNNIYVNIAKIIVLVKFLRMFDIDELYIRKFSTRIPAKITYVISKQFITIFMLAHTIGLFFYAIDFALVNDPICQDNNSLCWLYSATAYSPIIQYDWQIQYFYTLYWGVNTICTISYGDIAPNNPIETPYAIFCFCFGFIVYGYVVNNIIKVFLWARKRDDNFKSEVIIYTTFMDNLKINKTVQYDMTDYLQHQFLEEKERIITIEDQMKSRLPQDLREELLRSAYFKIHNHLQYIFLKSPSITKLIYNLQEKKYTQNEVILKHGAPLSKLYYLHQGQVSLSCLYGRKQQYIASINNSDSFLSHYEFILNQRATYSITISRTTTLYIIDRQNLNENIQKYTDLRENFKLTEYELRCDQNYKKIFYQCFFCRSNHHWYECFDVFPNFSNTKFILPQPQKKRHYKNTHRTWANKSLLSDLVKMHGNPEFMLLQKMKQRIYELKKLKEGMKSSFDVDVGYDWQYFLPNYNFSVFKNRWNQRRVALSMKVDPTKLFMSI